MRNHICEPMLMHFTEAYTRLQFACPVCLPSIFHWFCVCLRFYTRTLCLNIMIKMTNTLRWRHNDHAGVSNHQPHGCLLNRLFRRKSKKTSKLRVTGLCAGNSPGTGEFPAQMASYAENVSTWWRHHDWSIHWYPICISCLKLQNTKAPSFGKWLDFDYIYLNRSFVTTYRYQ